MNKSGNSNLHLFDEKYLEIESFQEWDFSKFKHKSKNYFFDKF